MRANSIFVKPAREGLIVRRPERNYEPIPAGGASVPNNSYYLRRLEANEIVECERPVKTKARARSASRATAKSVTSNTEASE